MIAGAARRSIPENRVSRSKRAPGMRSRDPGRPGTWRANLTLKASGTVDDIEYCKHTAPATTPEESVFHAREGRLATLPPSLPTGLPPRQSHRTDSPESAKTRGWSQAPILKNSASLLTNGSDRENVCLDQE